MRDSIRGPEAKVTLGVHDDHGSKSLHEGGNRGVTLVHCSPIPPDESEELYEQEPAQQVTVGLKQLELGSSSHSPCGGVLVDSLHGVQFSSNLCRASKVKRPPNMNLGEEFCIALASIHRFQSLFNSLWYDS